MPRKFCKMENNRILKWNVLSYLLTSMQEILVKYLTTLVLEISRSWNTKQNPTNRLGCMWAQQALALLCWTSNRYNCSVHTMWISEGRWDRDLEGVSTSITESNRVLIRWGFQNFLYYTVERLQRCSVGSRCSGMNHVTLLYPDIRYYDAILYSLMTLYLHIILQLIHQWVKSNTSDH